jgi:hypothetical protein
MINARELRIGNFVNHGPRPDNKLEGNSTVVSINDLVKLGQFPNWFHPIPLTEDWLRRFGFESLTRKSAGFKADTYTYTRGVSLVLNHGNGNTWTNFWQGNEMKYVHQLQNLFHALTGEELTLND